MVTFAEFDLTTNSQISGQAVYLLVQANVMLPSTGLSLIFDDGSGKVHSSSDSDVRMGWHAYTYQVTMGVQGTAKVGVQVFTSNSSLPGAGPVVEFGHVVLAPIGNEWTRL